MKILRSTFFVLGFGLAVSCSSATDSITGSDDDSSDESSSVSTSTLSGLGLSSALSVDVPDTVSASGSSSLALTGGKSQEACHMRQTVKDGLDAIASVANMFCHFEAESDQISYDVKYQIDLVNDPMGDEDEGGLQLWIDSSKANDLVVQFCQGGTLTEVIHITGATDDKVKGTMTSHGSEEGQSWGRSVVFDSGFTKADVVKLIARDAYTSEEGDEFRRMIAMHLDEAAVSKVGISERGEWMGETFQNQAAGKFDGEHGQVLYSFNGQGDFGSFEFVNRAHFDAAGLVVSPSVTPNFEEGGTLFVGKADVPGQLPSDFEPAAFDADGFVPWDCTTDVTIEIDFAGDTGAAHEACEEGRDDFSHEECWGEEYEQGDSDDNFDPERDGAEGGEEFDFEEE